MSLNTRDTPVRRGLTATEVAQRVTDGKTNDVPNRVSRTMGQIIRSNVFTRINAIYGVLFAVVMSTGHFADGIFGILIVLNSAIGMIQEVRAKRTLDKLAVVSQFKPRVLRDGVAVDVIQTEVVLDNVIELAAGDKVVVDGVVLDASSLEVDESLLTGESDPIMRRPGDEVMSGSFVVAGSGTYRATKVGRQAYAARIAEEAGRFAMVKSGLRADMDRILTSIVYMLVPVGALTIYNQLFQIDAPLPDALQPMVPEGLILVTSIAFAVGVVRLGKRQCLVQELPAIEGLARVDMVCVDKTGTLTENSMHVAELRVLDADTPVVDVLVLQREIFRAR